MTRAYVWARANPLQFAFAFMLAFTLALVVAGVAEATHKRMDGGTGPVCPHCAWWNLVCHVGNLLDRCAPSRASGTAPYAAL